MKIQFNTGRDYSPHGQRIIAVQERPREMTPARVRFKDLDRGICGAIPVAHWMRTLDAYELQLLVMANYDLGNYEGAGCGDLQWEDES